MVSLKVVSCFELHAERCLHNCCLPFCCYSCERFTEWFSNIHNQNID